MLPGILFPVSNLHAALPRALHQAFSPPSPHPHTQLASTNLRPPLVPTACTHTHTPHTRTRTHVHRTSHNGCLPPRRPRHAACDHSDACSAWPCAGTRSLSIPHSVRPQRRETRPGKRDRQRKRGGERVRCVFVSARSRSHIGCQRGRDGADVYSSPSLSLCAAEPRAAVLTSARLHAVALPVAEATATAAAAGLREAGSHRRWAFLQLSPDTESLGLSPSRTHDTHTLYTHTLQRKACHTISPNPPSARSSYRPRPNPHPPSSRPCHPRPANHPAHPHRHCHYTPTPPTTSS